jgi:hypothetical protein
VNAAPRNWVAVASAEHVQRGREGGFMQVCHGKAAPLRRIRGGDRVVYYSPTASFRGKDRLQAFTALGTVRGGDPYSFDMGGGFCPHRRDVHWLPAHAVPIHPLLGRLQWAAGGHWGRQLRFGLFQISHHDMDLIARAMQTDLCCPPQEAAHGDAEGGGAGAAGVAGGRGAGGLVRAAALGRADPGTAAAAAGGANAASCHTLRRA